MNIMDQPAIGNAPYRPSNGTEGMIFQETYCERCAKYRCGKCAILERTMFYNLGDPNYPTQWQYDERRRPFCAAFLEKSEQKKMLMLTRRRKQQAAGQQEFETF